MTLKLLNQTKANQLLRKYKIPIVPSKICSNVTECKGFSKRFGFPVVLKIDSEDVVHKSDIGAVKINISNEKELVKSYNEIIKNVNSFKKDAMIHGMLIQKQVSGHNILIGSKRDPQFGPVIVFGLGGVMVELLKDVSRRITPVNKTDANNMIKEIKAYELLKGYRGEDGADIDSLVNIIMSLSKMTLAEKNIVEVDFNPVMSDKKKSFVVDARIMVEDN